MHLVELAACMGPARCQLDVTGGSKPIESCITVHMDDAFEALQMSRRTLSAPIRTVEIHTQPRADRDRTMVGRPGRRPRVGRFSCGRGQDQAREPAVVSEQSL